MAEFCKKKKVAMLKIDIRDLKDARNRFYLLSILIAVTLPFSVRLNGLAIILITLNALTLSNWKAMLQEIKTNKVALFFLLFYVLHVVSLAYTKNTHNALRDLETKIAFFIFPLVLVGNKFVDRSFVERVLLYFSWSCFIAAAVCMANALFWLSKGDSSYMFYHQLGYPLDIHAVYFSLYISVAFFVQLTFLQVNWPRLQLIAKVALISVVVFFLFFLLLLSSKTILIVFFMLLAFWLGRLLFRLKPIWIGLASLTALILFFFLSVQLVPNIEKRFEDVLYDDFDQTNPLALEDYQGYHFTGWNIRLAIWKICVQEVTREKAWLLGVGPGDSQDVLTESYVQKHIYPGDEIHEGFIHYNAHNQFFQYNLSVGNRLLSISHRRR